MCLVLLLLKCNILTMDKFQIEHLDKTENSEEYRLHLLISYKQYIIECYSLYTKLFSPHHPSCYTGTKQQIGDDWEESAEAFTGLFSFTRALRAECSIACVATSSLSHTLIISTKWYF